MLKEERNFLTINLQRVQSFHNLQSEIIQFCVRHNSQSAPQSLKMGSLCCASVEKQTSNKIEGYLDKEAKQSQQIKLLLLGCGSAGKSTLFKSLRISHCGGIDHTDLMSIIPLIRRHCIESILKLFGQCQLLYSLNNILHSNCNLNITNEIQIHINSIEEFRNSVCLDDQSDDWENVDSDIMNGIAGSINLIWKLPEIQATYHKRGLYFALEDNSDYYLNKINTIFNKNYIPSQEDYLKAKQRTVGMIDYEYQAKVSKSNFRIIDVGGQRSERRKWMSLFDKFCISYLLIFYFVFNLFAVNLRMQNNFLIRRIKHE